MYSTFTACQTACTAISPSWDCDGNGTCNDPGTGMGLHSTLAACQTACVVTPPTLETWYIDMEAGSSSLSRSLGPAKEYDIEFDEFTSWTGSSLTQYHTLGARNNGSTTGLEVGPTGMLGSSGTLTSTAPPLPCPTCAHTIASPGLGTTTWPAGTWTIELYFSTENIGSFDSWSYEQSSWASNGCFGSWSANVGPWSNWWAGGYHQLPYADSQVWFHMRLATAGGSSTGQGGDGNMTMYPGPNPSGSINPPDVSRGKTLMYDQNQVDNDPDFNTFNNRLLGGYEYTSEAAATNWDNINNDGQFSNDWHRVNTAVLNCTHQIGHPNPPGCGHGRFSPMFPSGAWGTICQGGNSAASGLKTLPLTSGNISSFTTSTHVPAFTPDATDVIFFDWQANARAEINDGIFRKLKLYTGTGTPSKITFVPD